MIDITLSTRQHKIIDLLIKQKSEITVAYIADLLGTSGRTIHRELIGIEQYLHSLHIELLKKSGIGIRIQASAEQVEYLKQQLSHQNPLELNAEERKIIILCHLLNQHEPMKLFSLSHELHVTMPTISSDIDDIETTLNKRGLKLIRRRGYGIKIIGSEFDKRQYIGMLITTHVDESLLINEDHFINANGVMEAHLLSFIDRSLFQTLERILWSLQDKLPQTLSQQRYTQLILNICLGISRFKNDFMITTIPNRSHVDAHNQQDITKQQYEHLYEQLISELLHAIPVELSRAEIIYLQEIVELAFQQQDDPLDRLELASTIVKLTRRVQKYVEEPLVEDPTLTDGLLRHMRPAIERIVKKIPIRNPMLYQIKKEYGHLFSIIQTEIAKLLPQLLIPDEEIGYITVHYGAAIERLKQLPKRARAVLVCTSGIGSSKLLNVRIAQEFPQIELLGHYTWYEAARMPHSDYDIIISTVDLPIDIKQYIRLSPLVTDDEIVKLTSFLKQLDKKNFPSTTITEKTNSIQRLQQLQQLTNASLAIIDQFQVIHFEDKYDQHATVLHLLPLLLQKLYNDGVIKEIHSVVEKLHKREEQGSIVIPDSQIALLHTRSRSINAPIVILYRFQQPILLNENDSITVEHTLLMLAPEQLDKSSLEILSEVSAMLLIDEMITCLQNGNPNEIQSFISSHLEKFIKQKFEWRD
ncbi:MAG TPA: BglG family transcription antiterminator [Candidatus Paenibacillus intestinavium]|nr:BglG family transcription antiterminator [Candidatus Paenibacillus intestinavium]